MNIIIISIIVVIILALIASIVDFKKGNSGDRNRITAILYGMIFILLTVVIIPAAVSFIIEILKNKPREIPPGSNSVSTVSISDENEIEQISIDYNLYAPVDNFIFPYSSEQRLTVEDLDAKFLKMNTDDQKYFSQLAIDEIFFRHGWAFYEYGENLDDSKRKMLAQFNQYDWFIEAKKHYPQGMGWEEYMRDRMNKIECSNIDLIAYWQNEHIP